MSTGVVALPEAPCGPYDALYGAIPNRILWRTGECGWLRRLSPRALRVLDAGCGDGANAHFLETQGCAVTGVDVSGLALEGLRNRFEGCETPARGEYFQADILDFDQLRDHELLVSCGLFHCLGPARRVDWHRRLNGAVRTGGLVLFTSLTSDIPLPDDHGTPSFTLPSRAEIRDLFELWDILHSEVSTISDQHAGLSPRHEHSIVRVVAKRR